MAKPSKRGVRRLEKRLEKARAAHDKVVARLERAQRRSAELAETVKTAEQELREGVARAEARTANRAAGTEAGPAASGVAAPSPDGSGEKVPAGSRSTTRSRAAERARPVANATRTTTRRSAPAQPRSRRRTDHNDAE